MPSLVIQIMQSHKAALLNQEREQMAAMARRWSQLETEIGDQVELFVRRVQADGLTPAQLQSRRFQLDRYRSLLAQVRTQLDRYVDYAEPLVAQRQGEIGRASVRAAEAAINAVGAENGVRIAFDRLPVEAIENMVGLAGEGSPLRALLTDSYGAGADAMLNQLIGATARGQNPQVTARAMVRNGLSQSLSRMMNVARTEQLRVGREATRQAYQASGVVEAYRRLATKDRRACIACLVADGETIPLDESLREHPSGRCTLIPIVTGMPLAQWEKGRDWFAKQSPGVQREILGAAKFDAWERGDIYMEQFVTVRKNRTWGDSLQPASLQSMLTDYKPFALRQPDPNREIRPLQPSAVIEPEPTPEQEIPADGFPVDPEALEVVKTLGGSTGAELVRDPATGDLFVRKRGNNAGHLLEEYYADQAYQALGVDVPEAKLYGADTGAPVKLAKFVEGRSLAEIQRSDPKLYKKVVAKLQKDFAADALLGNWDVVGMSADNILVDPAGNPWRIDNGGSLRYRAQGALKAEFSPYVDEFWTLRNRSINAQTADVYAGQDYYKIAAQMRKLTTPKQRAALLEALPPELQGIVGQRLDNLKDLAKIADTFNKDSWIGEYVDEFSRHSVGLRKAGIVGRFPGELTNRGVNVYDKSNKPWDHLRGAGSIIEDVANYMRGQGGDYSTISYWAEKQASDSWMPAARATKYFYASQRDKIEDRYWWGIKGLDDAKSHYDGAVAKLGKEKYDQSFTIWHAFNYEFMRNNKFANNNIKKGIVKLIRTENKAVMDLNGLKPGESGQIKRGAAESASVFERVTVFGTEVTTQKVPHHRVFGVYMMDRAPGRNHPLFLSDRENEIVAMMDGLEADYEK